MKQGLKVSMMVTVPIIALALTSCGEASADGASISTSTPRIAVASTPTAGVETPQEQSRFDGILMVRGDCVMGKRNGSDQTALMIFPFGTKVTESAVMSPDGKSVGFDQPAGFAGGFRNSDDYKEPLNSCPGDSVFVVNQIL